MTWVLCVSSSLFSSDNCVVLAFHSRTRGGGQVRSCQTASISLHLLSLVVTCPVALPLYLPSSLPLPSTMSPTPSSFYPLHLHSLSSSHTLMPTPSMITHHFPLPQFFSIILLSFQLSPFLSRAAFPSLPPSTHLCLSLSLSVLRWGFRDCGRRQSGPRAL